MRVTPLDVRKQEFRKSVRGFDQDEVRAFLATTADEYEAVLVDNKELRERIMVLEEKTTEYRDIETTLRDTMMTAEKIRQDAEDNARKEGELVVREAELTAQGCREQLRADADRMRREIMDLHTEKEAYLTRFRSLAQAQIQFVEDHQRDFEDLDRRLRAKAELACAPPASKLATGSTDDGVGAGPARSGGGVADQTDVWRDYSPSESRRSPTATVDTSLGSGHTTAADGEPITDETTDGACEVEKTVQAIEDQHTETGDRDVETTVAAGHRDNRDAHPVS